MIEDLRSEGVLVHDTCFPAMPSLGNPNAAVDTWVFFSRISTMGARMIRYAPAMAYSEKLIRVTMRATPRPPAPMRVSFSARTWSSLVPATTEPSPKSARPSKWRNLLPTYTVARTMAAENMEEPMIPWVDSSASMIASIMTTSPIIAPTTGARWNFSSMASMSSLVMSCLQMVKNATMALMALPAIGDHPPF